MYGKVNGKVIVRETKTGKSYNFQIVKNRRNPMSGRAENIVIWNFGTVKNTDITAKAKSFWKEVDMVVKQLVDSGKIYSNCRSEIQAKFERFIPRPVSAVAVPVPVTIAAKPLINQSAADRVKERLKGLV